MIKHLRYNTASVPPLYEESFKKAVLTFQHQRVYDPLTKDIVHLSNIPDSVGDELDFLGPYPLYTFSYRVLLHTSISMVVECLRSLNLSYNDTTRHS